MGYESYQAYLSANGSIASSPNAYFKDLTQHIRDKVFANASNYYTVRHKDRSTGIWKDVNVRLTNPLSIKRILKNNDDFFVVHFQDLDYEVFLGDLFEFGNYTFLTISVSRLSDISASAVIRRCNVKLRFTENTNAVLPTINSPIIELTAIADNKIYKLDEDQIVRLPTNELIAQVPYCADAFKIKTQQQGGTRFIIGGQGWTAYYLDSITDVRPLSATPYTPYGLINIRLRYAPTNAQIDNIAQSVAKQNI